MIQNKPSSRKQDPLSLPILGIDEVMTFLRRGLAQKMTANSNNRHSVLDRSGGHLSAFRGSGFDYDDSRAYQPGDDLRNINWRLMARTAELYTKLYREEREASVMLVIDRRASMRFGTRQCLKVTLAVKIAAFLAGVSLSQAYSVGLTLLQPNSQRMPPQRHQARVCDSLMGAAAACPPLAEDDEKETFTQILNRLQLSVSPGSHLVLLSDFHDISEADSVVLTHLASQHQIHAIQILDPVELDLPAGGVWLLDHYPGGQALEINANDAAVRTKYHHEMNSRQAMIENIFSQCQIPLTQTQTDLSFEDIMRQLGYA